MKRLNLATKGKIFEGRKKIKKLYFLVGICVLNLIFSSYCFAGDFTWQMKTPMHQSRSHCASVALNGKVYAIGSYVGGHSGTAAVEEYDPTTNTWTSKAPISNAVWGLRAAVANGKIYVFGGANNPGGNSTFFSTVEEYNPAANRWTLKSPMSEAKYNMAIAVFSDKIYIIGGTRGDIAFDTIDVYDPLTDTWTTKTPMPFHRHIQYFAQLGDKVYLFGNPTYVYDLATDSWSQRAAPPFDNVGGPAAAAMNGKIYVFGGSFTWGSTGPIGIPDVYEYDPSTDTWSAKTPMVTGVACLWQAASVVGNKVYVLGGQTAYPTQSTTLVQEGSLEPAIPTEPPVADAGEDIIASANEEVTLDGSGSSDPDGEIIQYTWKRLPEGVVIYSGKDSTCQTRALGRVEEVIELTVMDNYWATATDTLRIISRTMQDLQTQVDELNQQINPSISITSPADGAIVSRTITVSTDATAENFYHVFFYVDNRWRGSDRTEPFEFRLNTTTLSNGTHTIKVNGWHKKARKWLSDTVKVNVSN